MERDTRDRSLQQLAFFTTKIFGQDVAGVYFSKKKERKDKANGQAQVKMLPATSPQSIISLPCSRVKVAG